MPSSENSIGSPNAPQQPKPEAGTAPQPQIPPSGPIEARTMSSDIKSGQESGAGQPKPFIPDLSGLGVKSAESIPPSPAQGSQPLPSAQPSPFPPSSMRPPPAAPAPPFPPSILPKPPAPPPPPPPAVRPVSPGQSLGTVPPARPPITPPSPPKKRGGKGLFVFILSLLLVLGIGALVYLFVLPLFQEKEAAAPALQEPIPSPLPEVVVSPQVEAPVVAPEPETPVAPEVPPPLVAPEPARTHTSLFKTPADLTSGLKITSISSASLREQVAFQTAEVPALKELVLQDEAGVPHAVKNVLGTLVPTIFSGEAAQLFEEDFTFVVYTDAKGSWPVYLLKIKSGSGVQVDEVIKKIETASLVELASLFLADPGNAGVWKSGVTEGVSNRYSVFTQSGAGLNYARKENIVVIGTSYAAFRETLKRL